MEEPVRRSWLLVSASRAEQLSRAPMSGADVVVLDLVEFVAEKDKPAARHGLQAIVAGWAAHGPELFVQVDAELLYADLRACVWPGLQGVVISKLQSPEQIIEAHGLLGQLEEERGLAPNSLQILAAVETSQGNLNAYEIATASPRIWGLTLGRADLVMDLRPEPSGEVHLMQYLMQRLTTVAGAAGVCPVGAWWRGPDRGLLASPENTYQAALRGRAIGFKGSLCMRGDQVGSLNRGFTPAEPEVNEARSLLSTYEEAVGQGAGATRVGTRIIDVGAWRQAKGVIRRAEACAARDQATRVALEEASINPP